MIMAALSGRSTGRQARRKKPTAVAVGFGQVTLELSTQS
jgi:hypothetical protein